MNREEAYKIAKAADSRACMDLGNALLPPYATEIGNTDLNALHIFWIDPEELRIGAADYIAVRKSDGKIFRFQSGE